MEPDEEIVNYRCPRCEDCSDCKSSNRLISSSLKERSEQKLIEDSVKINYEENRVSVTLPFIKDPVAFLQKHFKSTSNYSQALSVYRTQCRKGDEVKVSLANTMRELEELGFIQRLADAPHEVQALVRESAVQHYHYWRSVYKASQSTPIRLIVDATSSLLNLIVAKGDTNLASMLQILLQCRSSLVCFSADIRKLYNMLYLQPESYPYSLFLFHPSMDLNTEPDVYFMLRAWYGISSTCSQAGTALRRLGSDHLKSHPLGAQVLLDRIFVDDSLSGCNSDLERQTQVDQLNEILSSAGMSLKYVAFSGQPPPEAASSDGVSMTVLGYTWYPEKDMFCLNLSELNFFKKSRGTKPNNPFPATSPDTIEKLVFSLPRLTRRHITAKCGEFFDPLGLAEPYRASLKRSLSMLNSLEWDDGIPPEEHERWLSYFKEWPELAKLLFKRSTVPPDASQPLRARLICCSDASMDCGGSAVYLSFLLLDGNWSAFLLVSKSKLMRFSVPRNEICALALGLELVYAAVLSITTPIESVLICTDSVVSLCWSMNPNTRNKVFIQNRVLTINRYMNWISERLGPDSLVQLAHIPGSFNIADILTKGHPKITDLDLQSCWQNGYSWMLLEIQHMPLTYYSDLTLSSDELAKLKEESHDIPFFSVSNTSQPAHMHINHSLGEFGETMDFTLPPEAPGTKIFSSFVSSREEIRFQLLNTEWKTKPQAITPLIDVIHFGWARSNRVLAKATLFCIKLFHNTHLRSKNSQVQLSLSQRCALCLLANQSINNSNVLTQNVTVASDNHHVVLAIKVLSETVINQYWNALATQDCRERLTQKDLVCCETNPHTGILYYKGRLDGNQKILVQDYDSTMIKFFDEFNFSNPCILPDTPIFYAFAIHVHFDANPHSGIESTLREIMKRFYPIRPRAILRKILSDCIKCRILQKRTLLHEMSNHSTLRFTIAPPFSHVMCDLAQPFNTKVRWNGRQTFKVPALVTVCLVTGAVGINMCEDWSTQSVMQALERHSSRYGTPSFVYVDQGTQMLKLKDVNFDIRDLTTQALKNLSCTVIAAPPKSHSHQGKVERKILHIRELLERLSESSFLQSFLGWETTMAKISNKINSLPICRPSARSVVNPDFDILTPNKLLLGFNNTRALSGPMVLDSSPSSLLERANEVEKCFFSLLLKQIHLLVPRSKWFQSDKLFPNDICLFFIEEGFKSRNLTWHYAKVISITGSRIKLEYSLTGIGPKKLIERSKRQLVRVCSEDELNFNTKEHFKEVIKPSGLSSE